MLDSIFEVIFVIGFVVGCVIRAVYTRGCKQNTVTDVGETGLEKLLMGLAAIGLLVLPLLYVLTPRLDFADYHLPTWAGWLGAPVFAVALWLLWRSHADLGRNWSAKVEIGEGQSLVTDGVFRHIRHPMYAAHWLWAMAQALLLHNWIAGPALLATFLPLYLVRVPREEQMMLEQFGEEYRSYMSRTGRIMPRLSR